MGKGITSSLIVMVLLTITFSTQFSNAFTNPFPSNPIQPGIANDTNNPDKIDVWDFGAQQLDTAIYLNKLTVDIINSWYAPSVVVGSSGNILPDFSAGILGWTGGGNDRLRTTNNSITRYDENIASVNSYTGRLYVNSAANVNRWLSLDLNEDDEVTLIAKTDAGGNINFQFVSDPLAQTDQVDMSSDLKDLHFVAKHAGTYHIFDNQGKPSYYRIYRKGAEYIDVSGIVDVTQAPGLPGGYAVVFENEAGKTWEAIMNGNEYSVSLPAGYIYSVSLSDANGYIITSGSSLEVSDATTTHDITVQKVELYTVTGNITGLDTAISSLGLLFMPTSIDRVFNPKPVIDAGSATFSVQLEPNTEYSVTATGVNDYFLTNQSLTIGQADETFDLVFSARPLYKVNITTNDLDNTQLDKLGLIFSNLHEEGYSYRFISVDSIYLRNGVYTMDYFGLDEYPVKPGLNSNLVVSGDEVAKPINFVPIKDWTFDDKEIPAGSTAYNGLLFSGQVTNEVAKGHLAAKPGGTIEVPLSAGEKLRITFYYSADFSIEGGNSYTTSSGSTGKLEYAEYNYPGTEDGYVTITIGQGASTTYISEISVRPVVAYSAEIHVGPDKKYKTINAALNAIVSMERNGQQRVTVLIDPGNYEEMLFIDVPGVTLKNASGTPGTDILNQGVDIGPNAVRITSYYGHGYNYYSMGKDQKWHADILRVNKENGYLSYENKGAGTTNGSYWNATVVVAASGFEADHIIFENSFNQYISRKESEDVIVPWESGSKGERPENVGNTDVQDRSFVERAAAIAFTAKADKVVLNKCRVIGRQDSFFGDSGARVVVFEGAVMGAVDFIFGGMTAVFYKADLVMNTSDDSDDRSYLTAAHQTGGRGFLMYECKVTPAEPVTETVSDYLSKPGYFGRPWLANTSEVVFYNTTIDTSGYPGYVGRSLINPVGWLNTLGGESPYMYEYGTTEISGENNSSKRASWSTVLAEPILDNGVDINTFNFTRGSDNWDPLPELIAADGGSNIAKTLEDTVIRVYAYDRSIIISNVQSEVRVNVYTINGSLVKSFMTRENADLKLQDSGVWIVKIEAGDRRKVVKVVTL